MENVSRRASQERDLCGPTGLYTRKAMWAVETAILKSWGLSEGGARAALGQNALSPRVTAGHGKGRGV